MQKVDWYLYLIVNSKLDALFLTFKNNHSPSDLAKKI